MVSLSSSITFEVFLSFRGPDTRQKFTSHLHAALLGKNIKTFIDDSLDKGEEISQSLLKAIEESKMSVIIFSENYGSSRWCLDELVKIMECVKTMGRKVLPIFYQVNPCDVRHQIGGFGKEFGKVKEKFRDRVETWSNALTKAANLSGWDSSNYKHESELIEGVVHEIKRKLYPISFSASTDLVGIDSHIEQIIALLCLGSTDVRFIGIWGMGGIGKTTIAEALISQISDQFDDCCFFGNVRENSEKHGLVNLRKCFLSTLLRDGNLNIEMLHVLPTFVMDTLKRKKIVIVLDDVNDSNQLEALAGNHDWFGPGSRIIVTGRDKEVLNGRVDKIYEVQGLQYYDALQLLSMKAFKQKYPPGNFIELSKRVINYAKGVPLALKVLGSHLCKRSIKEWESALNKLKQFPDSNIQKVLKISYDELDQMEKDIFLDIACFFKGYDKTWVEDILDGCGFSTSWGLIRLMDKCLITIMNNMLEMHDLIMEMGQDIARQKGSRLLNSNGIYHLLTSDMEKKAVEGLFLDMSEIRTVYLSHEAFSRMPNLRLLKFYRRWYFLENEARGSISTQSNYFESLPSKLSLLHWEEYPCKSLPSNFSMENLVKLIMPRSKVEQLWSGFKCPQKLKWLDLSSSAHLKRLPDLSGITNLEWMDLSECESLFEISSSIQYLKRLTYLDLSWCKKLRTLPSLNQLKFLKLLRLSHCSNLKMLPEIPRGIEELTLNESGLEEWSPSIRFFDNLKYFDTSYCKNLRSLPSCIHYNTFSYLDLTGCSNLIKLPEIIGSLEVLILNETEIEELPSSIQSHSALFDLVLQRCERLKSLPSSISELKCLERLVLSGCSKLEKLPAFSGLCCLKELYLDGTALVQIPADIVSLSSLRMLTLNNCKKLQGAESNSYIAPIEFSKTEWGYHEYQFNFYNCLNLNQNGLCQIIEDAKLRIKDIAIATTRNEVDDCRFLVGLPGSEIPEWFSYQSLGSSINIMLPRCFFNTMFLGFAFCVVLEFEVPLVIKETDTVYFSCEYLFKNANGNYRNYISCKVWPFEAVIGSDHVFLCYMQCSKTNNWLRHKCFSFNKASFEFEVHVKGRGVYHESNNIKLKVKRCGVHLAYAKYVEFQTQAFFAV